MIPLPAVERAATEIVRRIGTHKQKRASRIKVFADIISAELAKDSTQQPIGWALNGPLGFAATLFFKKEDAEKHASLALSVVPIYSAPSASLSTTIAPVGAEQAAREAALEINNEIANNTANYDFLDDSVIAEIILKHCYPQVSPDWVPCSEIDAEAAAKEVLKFETEDDGQVLTDAKWVSQVADIIRKHGRTPEGWQLVPIHPTEEMLLAGLQDGQPHVTRLSTRTWVWEQMLSAAPKK